ncbi:MAG: trypsin-like peptidase domain-containing protein, partial [Burkholderiales bacterium]|nr:trypsin-like peptidase domain-containing protein [Burkholderiales bacterium]
MFSQDSSFRLKPLAALCHGLVLALGVATTTLPAVAQAQPGQAVVRGLPDFTELVEQVGPSVVNIRTLEKVRGGNAANAPDEQMLEFFRRFGIPVPPGAGKGNPRQERGGSDEERPTGVGSGFILTSDGFIMTNAHVVDGADELLVTLPDKREFKARVVGADKRTDVAVVKIEALGLPAVRIGDANRIKVGEWVMAIGSPFGLENSVTAGIVSAKQRDTGDYLPFIQTDVAINPGNSGGPLINMRGEVIGINSQIYSRSGGFMGISFAIPIDEAMRVSEQLRATGKVTRGRIGVSIDQVPKDVAESLGLPEA